jgi:hypothetical protein
MKSFYKTLSIIFIAFFILGVFLCAYMLFRLPSDLINEAKVMDLMDMYQVRPVLNRLYLTVGGVLTMGMIALIIRIVAERGNNEENIVYVETYGGKKDKKKNKDNEDQTEAFESADVATFLEDWKSGTDLKENFTKLLSKLANKMEASQGAVFKTVEEDGRRFIELFTSYAYMMPESQTIRYEFGEGLSGQVAKEGKMVYITEVPLGYIKIFSGLGGASPKNLVITPVTGDGKVKAVVELAFFKELKKKELKFIESLFEEINKVMSLDEAPSKTSSKASKKSAESSKSEENEN